jgi:hypothetical protein
MKQFTSKIFLTGLIAALSVVLADYLQSIITNTPMSVNALIIAAAIAVIGYLGNFLTGTGNTTAGIVGSALLAIIPLISTGQIDWKLIMATIALKLLGLFTDGAAVEKKPS